MIAQRSHCRGDPSPACMPIPVPVPVPVPVPEPAVQIGMASSQIGTVTEAGAEAQA